MRSREDAVVARRSGSRMAWIFLLAFGGLGGIVAVASVVYIINVQRIHADYRPVPAIVYYSKVVTDSGNNNDTYRPDVRYSYTVRGKQYRSRRDTIISYSASGGWARRVVRRYPAGAHCTAYYDPAHPANAILLDKLSFVPYGSALFGMVFVCAGVGAFIGMRGNSRWAAAGATDSAQPEEVASLAARRKHLLLVIGLIPIPALALCGDYFIVAAPPYGWLAEVVSGIVLLGAAVCVWLFLRSLLVGGVLDDPVVRIAPVPAQLGKNVACAMQVHFKKPVTVQSAVVVLEAKQNQITRSAGEVDSTTVVAWTQQQILNGGGDFAADVTTNWAAQFALPTDITPTGHFEDAPVGGPPGASLPGRFGAMRGVVDCHWQFKLTVKFKRAPAYHGTYRFEVMPADLVSADAATSQIAVDMGSVEPDSIRRK